MTEGVNNNTNTGANLTMYAAMPAMTLTLSAGHGITGARGISKAIKLQNNAGFKNLNKLLKNEGCDVFTRSLKISEEYDKHKNIIKDFNKWNNKANAIKNGKLGLKDRFFNFFRKGEKKLTTDIIENNASRAANLKTMADDALNGAQDSKQALNAMDDSLAKFGKNTADNAKDAIKTADNVADAAKGAAKGAKVAKKGFKGTVGKLFKRELTSKFNIAITALTFIPNVINRVIPAFKEQGFGAGIKETGKVLAQAGTDLVSYALGGALGRTIGSVIGTVICPGVGTAIGGQIGDMAGSMLIGTKVTKTVDKVIGADEETEEKLKEEREANKAAKQALAYTPNAPQPRFDAQF